ncbi:MAG: phage portal protein [Tepidisphaeraceae bacterium]
MRAHLSQLNSNHPALADDGSRLRMLASRLLTSDRIRFDRLWAYYRNPMRIATVIDGSSSQRPYIQAQEWGLPSRITGVISDETIFDGSTVEGVQRKEVVIENDIGWRIDSQVDFLFGRAIVLNSASPDATRQRDIETLLRLILAHNGGLVFLQKVALLGAVYGSIDILVKFDPAAADNTNSAACATQFLGATAPAAPSPTSPGPSPAEPAPEAPATPAIASGDASTDPGASQNSLETLQRLARMVRFEIVDPTRALPLLAPDDCLCVDAFATVYTRQGLAAAAPPPTKWWRFTSLPRAQAASDNGSRTLVEIITPTAWQKYDDFVLVDSGANTLGRLPLVHIQNTADPSSFAGASDVEPLIPLQDELNTRLSDRAYRIAMTSLKMYLGKNIDNFLDLPISPGRMWSAATADASIEEFGGDKGSPSEDLHISEVREALDKLSGVSPVAAGTVKDRIGNLTSAAALRVTLMALLSRTERKRVTYGTAIAQLCELALAWLDHAGLFPTTEADRAIEIHWPNPLPTSEMDPLEEAAAKEKLGIPQATVLRELGY